MALHAVIYRYVDDSAALDEHRPSHREFLAGLHQHGTLLVSGPLIEGGGPGALLILSGDSADDVATTLNDDPFHKQNLIAEREIRGWNVVFGPERLA